MISITASLLEVQEVIIFEEYEFFLVKKPLILTQWFEIHENVSFESNFALF